MRGVQRKLLRGLIDWLVERGSLSLFDGDGRIDPASKKGMVARDEMVDRFLAERGESLWPKPKSAR